jgi:hypothetical protein
MAGAVIGIVIAAWFADDGETWNARLFRRVDAGFALLGSGFKL